MTGRRDGAIVPLSTRNMLGCGCWAIYSAVSVRIPRASNLFLPLLFKPVFEFLEFFCPSFNFRPFPNVIQINFIHLANQDSLFQTLGVIGVKVANEPIFGRVSSR